MKKLVIQIPCLNEEVALPKTLAALPKNVQGFDSVEVLVIDDGSVDATPTIALTHGARLVRLPYHQGLSSAYMGGLEEALRMGAHTIVNFDADNQYNADDIELLTNPIIKGEALAVVGERPLATIKHFSAMRLWIHLVGNCVIRLVIGLPVHDATSGFRAVHRDIARQIVIYSRYTYTIEMLVLLSSRRIPTFFVPIRVNNQEQRPSRLIKSNFSYLYNSVAIIIRSLFIYRPMRTCLVLVGIFAVGTASFVACYFMHLRPFITMILACTFGLATLLSLLAGILGDMLSANRILLEQARSKMFAGPHE